MNIIILILGFGFGAAVGAILTYTYMVLRWSSTVERPGYITFEQLVSETREEGRPGSNVDRIDPGGGSVTPPPHLRVVRDQEDSPQAGQDGR